MVGLYGWISPGECIEHLYGAKKRITPVLSRANVLIIGLHPKHVTGGVDQPGAVKDNKIPRL